MKSSSLVLLLVLSVCVVASCYLQGFVVAAESSSVQSDIYDPDDDEKKTSKYLIENSCRMYEEKKNQFNQIAKAYNENYVLIKGLETVIAKKSGRYGSYDDHLNRLNTANKELAHVQVTLSIHMEALDALCSQNNTLTATPTIVKQ